MCTGSVSVCGLVGFGVRFWFCVIFCLRVRDRRSVRFCPRGRVSVMVRVRTLFERRSGDRTRVDGFCDFEKVPPDH